MEVTVTVQIPASGFVYLATHLDSGRKHSGGYVPDGQGNALDVATESLLLVPKR